MTVAFKFSKNTKNIVMPRIPSQARPVPKLIQSLGFFGSIDGSFLSHSRPIPKPNISEDGPLSYHSTGGMNPIKLKGILESGIFSRNAAVALEKTIDSNGLGCNGSQYISVSTMYSGCMSSNQASFNFVIDRNKLTTHVRSNTEQDMPFERQIGNTVPREAIIAIQLGAESFLPIDNPKVMLGIGQYAERAKTQVDSHIQFLKEEFGYSLPHNQQEVLDDLLLQMEKNRWETGRDLTFCHKKTAQIEALINHELKGHLNHCYGQFLSKDTVTAYDILRYHDPVIDVRNQFGEKIIGDIASASEQDVFFYQP